MSNKGCYGEMSPHPWDSQTQRAPRKDGLTPWSKQKLPLYSSPSLSLKIKNLGMLGSQPTDLSISSISKQNCCTFHLTLLL